MVTKPVEVAFLMNNYVGGKYRVLLALVLNGVVLPEALTGSATVCGH